MTTRKARHCRCSTCSCPFTTIFDSGICIRCYGGNHPGVRRDTPVLGIRVYQRTVG